MAEMVTRCPQCSTSFRITPAQIQKARGAVRCGSCLHIFNAEKHLVEGRSSKRPSRKAPAKPAARVPSPRQEQLAIDATPPAKAPKAPERPKAPQKTPDQHAPQKKRTLSFDQAQIDRESEIDDDLLISDDMDRKGEEDNALYIDDTPAQSYSLFERNIEKRPQEFIDESDESWAESLLEEDTEASTRESSQDGDRTAFKNPLSIVNAENDDEQGESIESPPPQVSDSSAYTAPEPTFSLAAGDDDEQDEYSEKLRAWDSDRSALLMGIESEPVEMTHKMKAHWKRRLLWGGLSLLALIVLATQIAWFQFDRLSRAEPYRDYYAVACQYLDCELPPLSDPARIRTFNLVVRNHPDRANALVVDAIILNGAPYEQPYPNLQLTFTDINNEPVASRVFTRREYLKGELAGSTIMPKNQPIHLSLELFDPGEEAVNYRLDIR